MRSSIAALAALLALPALAVGHEAAHVIQQGNRPAASAQARARPFTQTRGVTSGKPDLKKQAGKPGPAARSVKAGVANAKAQSRPGAKKGNQQVLKTRHDTVKNTVSNVR